MMFAEDLPIIITPVDIETAELSLTKPLTVAHDETSECSLAAPPSKRKREEKAQAKAENKVS